VNSLSRRRGTCWLIFGDRRPDYRLEIHRLMRPVFEINAEGISSRFRIRFYPVLAQDCFLSGDGHRTWASCWMRRSTFSVQFQIKRVNIVQVYLWYDNSIVAPDVGTGPAPDASLSRSCEARPRLQSSPSMIVSLRNRLSIRAKSTSSSQSCSYSASSTRFLGVPSCCSVLSRQGADPAPPHPR